MPTAKISIQIISDIGNHKDLCNQLLDIPYHTYMETNLLLRICTLASNSTDIDLLSTIICTLQLKPQVFVQIRFGCKDERIQNMCEFYTILPLCRVKLKGVAREPLVLIFVIFS